MEFDFNKLIARVKNILLTPRTEWPVIAAEPETVQGLYTKYIIWIAALPAIAMFVKLSIIGSGVFGFNYRESIGSGLARMLMTYAISLGAVYVSALIADALAPNFGAQKNQTQALKAIAYSWTATWVAHIGFLLGFGLGALCILAGLIYAIMLLNQGLQQTMKCPADRSAGYTAVTIILTILLVLVVQYVVLSAMGLGAGFGGVPGGRFNLTSHDGGSISIDQSSALGKLAAIGQKAEEASKKMEIAQKSGDANAQAQAAGQMVGAILGGGDQVEALAPDVLKPFVPETLAGLKRTDISAERNGAMGMQFSQASANYTDGAGHSLHLEIGDMGSAKGLTALAGWAGVEQSRETDHGYDKTYKQNGRITHEEWDTQSKYGEFSLVLGDRFTVKVRGNADNIDQIKGAVGSLNLGGLEALKNQGVKKQ